MKTATIVNAKSHRPHRHADIEAGEEVVITQREKLVARRIAELPTKGFDWAGLRAWVAEAPATADMPVAQMREHELL